MNILIASASPADAKFFPDALPGHEVRIFQGLPEGDLADIEAIAIVHGVQIPQTLLDSMPKLRLIVTRSTGYDHVDLRYAAGRGIAVSNVPEYGSVTVAEFTFGLILSLTRRIPLAVARTRAGVFSVSELMGMDLEGKTLGIVGLGKIGRNLARMAKGFEMKVVCFDPFVPESIPLQELLAVSDVVALCCPLTADTHHLLNAEAFHQMKPTAFLVNTSRGPVVDSAALLAALDSGRLAGAALDVLEGEASLQAADRALMNHPRALVTPHLAYDSEEAVGRIRETTAEILRSFSEGKAMNTVSG